MPNSLALSSVTSCCVIASGNKQFLPRHALHPKASGKTPSSSFSTRVVANKSGGSASSQISGRKAPGPNNDSNGPFHKLGISLPFKAFPISARIGHNATEPIEGPNYENTNIGQISNMAAPVLNPKERSVIAPNLLLDDEDECPMAPYENLNMEYIGELTREGYTADLVIRALGISRNDVDMAREILNEFGGSRS